MKESVYHKMAAVEDRHWWFRGRRAIVRNFLDRLRLPPDARILEIGCGSGGNFALLSRYGRLSALENDLHALSYAADRQQAELSLGRLPDDLPFASHSFDLVCLFDVLEHVVEDERSLVNINRLVVPGGRLILTVPAGRSLWSSHDEVHHHQRRYHRAELVAKTRAAGFYVMDVTYFNTILLPVIACVRWTERFRSRRVEADLDVPAPFINRTLYRIFASERWFHRHFAAPFGVSLLLVGSNHA